jgi:hypothetical protein
MLGLAAFGGTLGRLRQRQADGHRRVIGHAIVHKLVEFAHSNREVGGEPIALSRTSRIINEGLTNTQSSLKRPTNPAESRVNADRCDDQPAPSILLLFQREPRKRTCH